MSNMAHRRAPNLSDFEYRYGSKADMHVTDFPVSLFDSRSMRPRDAFNSPENVLDVPCARPRIHYD
jgi:hypothetical protein